MAFVNLPPNFQDMFAKIDDRISKLETGPNQAMYTAEIAIADAGTASAQATQALEEATQALIQAQGAYAISSQALIKDSNTIVNAQNQLTGINGNGITVYSGASSTSGARVVLNSAGLTGFNSSGTATFAINASTGAVSTNGAIFTSSTITGGSLNINGNAIIDSAGYLTAYGANITGTINANSGSFTGNIYGSTGNIGGWYFNSVGLYNGTATASIASSDGAIVSAGTSSLKKVSINGGSIGSFSLAVAGDSAFENALTVSGALTTQSNLTANGSATFGTSNQFQYLSSSGTLRSAYTYGKAVTGRAMQIASNGDFGTTASTRRKKHNIEPYAIDSQALLQLGVKTFKYLQSIDADQKPQHGFIAEEAQALGLDELIQYDADGIPDYFAYEKLPIFLLQLVQEQNERIKALEAKLQ